MNWIDVPLGTPPGRCRSCRKTIYWVTMPSGKSMPVDVDVPEGKAPKFNEESPRGPHQVGRGVSHFATCPTADQHRKKKVQQDLPL